jgi:hypothetical protein
MGKRGTRGHRESKKVREYWREEGASIPFYSESGAPAR